MCFEMPKLTREIEAACEVGSLRPGQIFRNPKGQTLMVTNGMPLSGQTMVVCLDDGTLTYVSSTTKLGYDREGRLYAARRLNKPVAPAADAMPSRDSDGNPTPEREEDFYPPDTD